MYTQIGILLLDFIALAYLSFDARGRYLAITHHLNTNTLRVTLSLS